MVTMTNDPEMGWPLPTMSGLPPGRLYHENFVHVAVGCCHCPIDDSIEKKFTWFVEKTRKFLTLRENACERWLWMQRGGVGITKKPSIAAVSPDRYISLHMNETCSFTPTSQLVKRFSRQANVSRDSFAQTLLREEPFRPTVSLLGQ